MAHFLYQIEMFQQKKRLTMPKYEYKCDVCNHDYVEVRDIDDPQFKVACVVTGCTGTNLEVTE